MNSAPFRRSEALESLESYARIIVVHLALLSWFPRHDAKNHWQAEIHAFIKILRRYDSAKKRAHNFTQSLIIETLEDEISDNNSKDAILIAVEGHGVKAPEEPDFEVLAQSIKNFAETILK